MWATVGFDERWRIKAVAAMDRFRAEDPDGRAEYLAKDEERSVVDASVTEVWNETSNVVYLTRNGTPTAAILPIDELRRLAEAEEELEDLRAWLAADRERGETASWDGL